MAPTEKIAPFIDALPRVGTVCIIWPFARDVAGYAHITTGSASRYICTKFNGTPPTPEHDTAHSCGRGHEGCIAPYHVSWKSKTDNEHDKALHGTVSKGEKHGAAYLTETDVYTIRRMLREGHTQRETADAVGATRSAVQNIVRGLAWAWLKESVDV